MSDEILIRERTRIIELPEPVSFKSKSWAALELRVPKMGELKRAQAYFKNSVVSATMMNIAIVSIVTGIPLEAIEEIETDFSLDAADWLFGFIPKPKDDPSTGERTRTIEFPQQLEFNGQSWAALELRVPKMGELKKAQTHYKGTVDSATQVNIAITSIVSGIPLLAVEKIDIDLGMEAAEWLLGFMPKPPQISET